MYYRGGRRIRAGQYHGKPRNPAFPCWGGANTMRGLPVLFRVRPMSTPFSIQRIDARQSDVRLALDALRRKLSPAGNIVGEAGRRRTIEVFGEPLSPQQVVERICGDVQARGLAAVLEYSQKLDKAE